MIMFVQSWDVLQPLMCYVIKLKKIKIIRLKSIFLHHVVSCITFKHKHY